MRNRVAVMILAVGVAGTWLSAATRIPARETFRDLPEDRIQSDRDPVYSNGYEDGIACVVSWVQSNFFFMRTYRSSCFQSGEPPSRKITLDFSDAVSRASDGSTADPCVIDDAYGQAGTLNICGANVVADVRVIANNLFGKNAGVNGTPVSLPFSLSADYSNTAFLLEFEQNVRVIPDPATANAREMEALPDAVAELYKYGSGKGGKLSLGRYRMPFRLRVEKLY